MQKKKKKKKKEKSQILQFLRTPSEIREYAFNQFHFMEVQISVATDFYFISKT